MRVVPLEQEHVEGLRMLRNRPSIRAWFLDSREVDPEQQRAWFARYLSDPDDQMWVGLDGQRVVAAVGLTRIDPQTAEFGRLMSDRSIPGAGRRLLRTALSATAGIPVVFLEVKDDNLSAIALYESEGFVMAGGAGRLLRMELRQ